MRKLIDKLNEIDIIGLCLEIGIGAFVLISLVRCALD